MSVGLILLIILIIFLLGGFHGGFGGYGYGYGHRGTGLIGVIIIVLLVLYWPAPGFTDTEIRCHDGTGGVSWIADDIRGSSRLRQ